MNPTTTRRAALALIAGGAVLGLGETVGFTTVRGGRNVSISTVDDPNALLGVAGVGTDETLEVTNRSGVESMEITLDAVEDDVVYEIDGAEEPDPVTFELASGDSQAVSFESTGGRAEIDVDFAATLRRSGTDVGSIALRRTVGVPQAEQIDLTPNVTSSGNSGKFSFEIVNEGEIDVAIDAIALVETSSDAAEIDDELEDRDGGGIVPGPISFLDREPEAGDFQAFDAPPEIAVGDTNEFRADRFVDGQGKNADMRGARVVAMLLLEDGSTVELDMVDE